MRYPPVRKQDPSNRSGELFRRAVTCARMVKPGFPVRLVGIGAEYGEPCLCTPIRQAIDYRSRFPRSTL